MKTSVGQVSPVHKIEPEIAGLRLGEVQYDLAGKAQAYFGGKTVSNLTHIGDESLRDGAVKVAMYTIDGTTETDYAVVTMTTEAYKRSAIEKAIARRTGGGGLLSSYVERTLIQRFTSERKFTDIPISGIARWLALSPEGQFAHGNFSSFNPEFQHTAATFGEGWTFAWMAEGSRPFVFGELCTPRFIDATASCPVGEAGITELDNSLDVLPSGFQATLSALSSGEQLRNIEANWTDRQWVS